jgi:hypothetical protein
MTEIRSFIVAVAVDICNTAGAGHEEMSLGAWQEHARKPILHGL